MDKILEILEKEGLTSLEFDLTVSPELYVRALTAGQLTAVAESLACHVDELSLLDNFKPYIR